MVHDVGAKEAGNLLGGALCVAVESGLEVGEAVMEVLELLSNGGNAFGKGKGGKFG